MKKNTISKDLISIIIPVHNGERFLQKSLQSLFYKQRVPFEVIVIDEESTDSTKEILDSFKNKIHLIKNKKWGGPSQARNIGIKMAKGNYIAFLDQDDIIPKNYLTTALKKLKSKEAIDILHSKSINIDVKDKFISEPHYQLLIGSLFMRKSVFDVIGLLDETLKVSDDFDFFDRIDRSSLNMVRFNHVGYYYRHHENNLSRKLDFILGDFMKMLRKKVGEKHEK